ncbi:hypothetical protein SAMN05660299_00264 [Megasphaera paucivorans]|uniref:Uncharacterized protein n=1 Tax=Megasphaera paucivorans TaxID=349095 RepID=A0A1G9QUF8_9FIRM|nr:hypothetical protein SAMN05660299_00264 [Megasphaera paucivorans]
MLPVKSIGKESRSLLLAQMTGSMLKSKLLVIGIVYETLC